MYIPFITTIDLGRLFPSNNQPMDLNADIARQFDLKTGYTQQEYFNGDVFTEQYIAVPNIRQPSKVMAVLNLDNQPVVDLSDILAAKVAGTNPYNG